MAKMTGGSLDIDSQRETEASGEDEAGGVADVAGPRRFRAKTIRPAPPSAPQRAGFGLVPPAPISARAGENWALGGATGPIFWRRRTKKRLGGFLGARLEMPLE